MAIPIAAIANRIQIITVFASLADSASRIKPTIGAKEPEIVHDLKGRNIFAVQNVVEGWRD